MGGLGAWGYTGNVDAGKVVVRVVRLMGMRASTYLIDPPEVGDTILGRHGHPAGEATPLHCQRVSASIRVVDLVPRPWFNDGICGRVVMH